MTVANRLVGRSAREDDTMTRHRFSALLVAPDHVDVCDRVLGQSLQDL